MQAQTARLPMADVRYRLMLVCQPKKPAPSWWNPSGLWCLFCGVVARPLQSSTRLQAVIGALRLATQARHGGRRWETL